MGGYSQPTQIPEIFRLRRAKNRVFDVFDAKNFPPAAGQNHVLCVFSPKIFSPAAGTQQTWVSKMCLRAQECASAIHKTISISRANAVPDVFTSVGTRFYYSQKQSRPWQQYRRRSCVFTSVGTRFYYSRNNIAAAQTQFLAFSRVQERASTIRKNDLAAAIIIRLINNIITTGGGIARRRRKFFTISPFKIQSKQCF